MLERFPLLHRAGVLLVGSAFVQSACGSSSSDNGSNIAVSGTCNYAPELLGVDAASRSVCHPARKLLNCTLPAGGGESCTTNDPAQTECHGAPGGSSCTSTCAANEYVATCGGVGPGPVPSPPAGCRSDGVVPAGIAFYCCPCG